MSMHMYGVYNIGAHLTDYCHVNYLSVMSFGQLPCLKKVRGLDNQQKFDCSFLVLFSCR